MLYFVSSILANYTCASHDFACANGICIAMDWRCDKEDDCGDMSDEADCAPSMYSVQLKLLLLLNISIYDVLKLLFFPLKLLLLTLFRLTLVLFSQGSQAKVCITVHWQ